MLPKDLGQTKGPRHSGPKYQVERGRVLVHHRVVAVPCSGAVGGGFRPRVWGGLLCSRRLTQGDGPRWEWGEIQGRVDSPRDELSHELQWATAILPR